MSRWLNRRFRVLVITMAAIIMLPSFRLDDEQDEHMIKALFIYNFTKHIEWPKGKINGNFIIGVMGNSPVFDRLNTVLKNRRIKDHPVELKKILKGQQIETCDILFVTRGESEYLREVNEKYDSYGVLIVTEDKTMAQKSSCINIIQKEERLKFELNDAVIKKEGLKISNQLYELAEKAK